MAQQLWGGRFSNKAANVNETLYQLNCSLVIDARLYSEDIEGSKAYAEALSRAGYLKKQECQDIINGLEAVRIEWKDGTIEFHKTDEDVHTVNERRLTEIVGEVGQRLHTGRSRNDQVVTDMRIWVRKSILEMCVQLAMLIEAAMVQAQVNCGEVMPGYTHMQRAQPVLFSHWLLSHAFAFREDCLRLFSARERCNVLPLGSGALAGNPIGIDRLWLAERLGFSAVTQNSMHAVGDRDFVLDFIYCCTMASLHLSRLAEDLIIYSTREFGYIKIADDYCTGSSLMPQKCNPDGLELVRGISGNVNACLMGMMMTIKGTPSTYNKDLQFDKQYCFEAFDKLSKALSIMEGVVSTMTLHTAQMSSSLSPDMLATDWAYYLVKKGVPFRRAHEYMGKLVALAESMSVEITEIPLEQLQDICPHFTQDVFRVTHEVIVEQYNSIGGTSTSSVRQQLQALKEFVSGIKNME